MSNTLIVASDDATLRRIRQFRYGIYVGELKFDHPDAQHGTDELYDELDAVSTNYALVDKDERIVAALRCTFLEDLPDPSEQIDKFYMRPFVDRFGTGSIATTSRFMFRPDQRKTANILKLLQASVTLGLQRGTLFNFGDTNTIWLDYFEHLGYRRYAAAVNDPTFGFHVPIVMMIRDLEYQSLIGSPITRYVSATEDDPISRDWFNARYGNYLLLSPAGRGSMSFAGTAAALGFDADALASGDFGGLPAELRFELVASCHAVEMRPGDRITRRDEVDDTLFVCLGGRLRGEEGNAADAGIAFGPGDVVGIEEFLNGGTRRVCVHAESDSLVLVLPARRLRKFLAVHAGIAGWPQAIAQRRGIAAMPRDTC